MNWLKDNIVPILAIMVTVFVFGFFTLVFITVRGTDSFKEITLLLIGTIGPSLGMVLGFYFASSTGSKSKEDIIAEQIKKNGQYVLPYTN